MKRDTQLDCYRALIMIYIVCVIHTYWFYDGNDTIISLALFEMPVIFFIAGTAQSFHKRHEIITTIINRTKRILLPYYIFIILLFLFLYICTVTDITFHNAPIDINQLDTSSIIKILSTGGNENIPFLGYTWFISVYIIISCSLPAQTYVMKTFGLSQNLYMVTILCLFILWRATGINSPENIVENFLCYNIFYMAGFFYYKKLTSRQILIISIFPIAFSVYAFISGIAVPMQTHKFPPDFLFLTYNTGVLCILSLIFGKLRIKYITILKIWNDRGYTIYLY